MKLHYVVLRQGASTDDLHEERPDDARIDGRPVIRIKVVNAHDPSRRFTGTAFADALTLDWFWSVVDNKEAAATLAFDTCIGYKTALDGVEGILRTSYRGTEYGEVERHFLNESETDPVQDVHLAGQDFLADVHVIACGKDRIDVCVNTFTPDDPESSAPQMPAEKLPITFKLFVNGHTAFEVRRGGRLVEPHDEKDVNDQRLFARLRMLDTAITIRPQFDSAGIHPRWRVNMPTVEIAHGGVLHGVNEGKTFATIPEAVCAAWTNLLDTRSMHNVTIVLRAGQDDVRYARWSDEHGSWQYTQDRASAMDPCKEVTDAGKTAWSCYTPEELRQACGRGTRA